MSKCKVCGGTDFYKEAGYFFCQTCQTQNEDVREEVLELRIDSTTRLRKIKIRQQRSDKSGEELGWTSWELYNFILIGLTNELIELGVPADIKMTVLQLWATYLGKIEVAFISTRKKCVPKLAKRYKKRDADIIYGKVQSEKRSRKRKRANSSTNTSVITSSYLSEGSSMRELNKNKKLLATADYDRYLQSQASSEGDGLSLFSQSARSIRSSSAKSSDYEAKIRYSSHAKEEIQKIKRLSKNIPKSKRAQYKEKHTSTQYKIGPNIITPMRLWAILYIALRIHNQPIQLGDMLRYGREGHLSYYKLDHLLPPEINLPKSEANFLVQNIEITHKGMRRIIASMAKLLGVWDLICPDFLPLISRYCQELGLPRGIQLYAERLIALSPPKMIFNAKKSYIPNYEGRAIAFIIVVMKTLLALDGITEYRISKLAEKINSNLNETYNKMGDGDCMCNANNGPCIIVHGGAGNFSDTIVMEKMTACKTAATNGYKELLNGKGSVDAIEAALWWLECDEFFNCSYGSVLNELGKVQMDASIMDGSTLKCGSIAAVSDIEHPISLAKYVMYNFPNTIFVGDGAKNLALHANFNWLSEGNMTSPMALAAFSKSEQRSFDTDIDNQSLLEIDALMNSSGTVGCVAYDGYSIAAGTSTGGLNNKLVGRVGDTPLLGCGTYATKNTGCSLTGHGESIMKLGLSREIVEDIGHNLTAEESLHVHFSNMLTKFEQRGGGVVLQSNGRWATYFTTDKLPYAVIEDNLITYGAKLYEERKEPYNKVDVKSCECKFPSVILFTVAIDLGLLNEKLFSFEEWQRYIECRKTILVHAHFPTKMKYSPDTHGIDDLYIKFLEFITSKADKKEPDVKSSKHFLPEELISAMTKYITNLDFTDTPTKALDLFPPSLTPLHSYIQYLMDHPLYDIPSVVRNDFFLTKVGYMTKPDVLVELATKCNVELKVIDMGLHFLEKFVPPFEQPRMPTVDELKQPVEVRDDSKVYPLKRSEDLNDYMHRKIPCKLKLDLTKEQYYDSTRRQRENVENIDLGHDFKFTETLPNGKLAIPTDSDDEDEEKDTEFTQSNDKRNVLLGNKFCDKYNLRLSAAEKESISKLDIIEQLRFQRKRRIRLARDNKGQFVKGHDIPFIRIPENNDECPSVNKDAVFHTSTQISKDEETHSGIHKFTDEALSLCGNVDIGDIDINETDIQDGFSFIDRYLNLSEISFLCDDADASAVQVIEKENAGVGKQLFFRPFRDYWMYHCIFSRVKPKNFAVFEKSLPRSFRWLLNECAHVVEMTAEDLYEEVCLIETYYAKVLKASVVENDKNNEAESVSKSLLNFMVTKW